MRANNILESTGLTKGRCIIILPPLLARQWQQVGYYMQHPTLSRTLLAMMRMLISQNTNCDYCLA